MIVISIHESIKEQLETMLEGRGYRKLATNRPDLCLFYRVAQTGGYCVLFLDNPEETAVTPKQLGCLRQKAVTFLAEGGIGEPQILSLLCMEDLARAKEFTQHDDRCWILRPFSRELVLYENQCGDMDGIRDGLERLLGQEDAHSGFSWERVPLVSLALVGLNVFLFVVCAFTGDLLYNKGAFSLEDLVLRGEWYRIVTAMFLHAGVGHLFGNMLLLYFAGKIAERYLGHIRYALLYLLSGVGGNLLSMWYESRTGYYRCVGASGAVFGIIGMLLALVLVHHGRLEEITLRRIVLMIAFSIYSGATGVAVNNVAHVGGLVAGFLLTLFLNALGQAERTGNL